MAIKNGLLVSTTVHDKQPLRSQFKMQCHADCVHKTCTPQQAHAAWPSKVVYSFEAMLASRRRALLPCLTGAEPVKSLVMLPETSWPCWPPTSFADLLWAAEEERPWDLEGSWLELDLAPSPTAIATAALVAGAAKCWRLHNCTCFSEAFRLWPLAELGGLGAATAC